MKEFGVIPTAVKVEDMMVPTAPLS
jgi:hypothetical protein